MKRLTRTFLICLALAACKPTSESPPAPTEPNTAGETASPAAELPAQSGPSAAACERAAELLRSATMPAPSSVDIDSARQDFASPDMTVVHNRVVQLAEAGSTARPLVAELEGMLGTEQLPLSHAVLETLVAISPDDAMRVGRFIAFDGSRMLPERHMGAAVLSQLGPEGMEAIAELYANAESELERHIARSGLDRAGTFPLASKDAFFHTTGLCLREADDRSCMRLYRDLSLVWSGLSPRNDAVSALVRSETESVLAAAVSEEWTEGFAAAFQASPNGAHQSLSRLQSLGVVDGLIAPAIRVVGSGRSALEDRRSQLLWLLHTGTRLEAHREFIEGRLAEVEGEPIAAFVGILALASGSTSISDATAESIASLAVQGRSSTSTAATIASVLLGRRDEVLAAIAPRTRPLGFDQLVSAASLDDVDAFLSSAADQTVPLASVGEMTALWSPSRREALSAAILATEPSGRILEIAARGVAPSPELAAHLAAAAADTELSPSVAWWLIAGGMGDTVAETARASVSHASSAQRRRAVQWANASSTPLTIDELYHALNLQLGQNEVETRDARAPTLYRLMASDVDFQRALDEVRANEREVGDAARRLVLARAYHDSCTETE